MSQITNKRPTMFLRRFRVAVGVLFFTTTWLVTEVAAQNFAWGGTARTELYSHYSNPSDGIASRSAGSALLNLGLGPKIWVGVPDFALSAEASFVFSPFALSVTDYKGLGAISFPLIAKLEFLGNSNLNSDGKFGFSIGGGVQYNKTELWYLKPSFKNQGVERSTFRTYVIEGDFGYGISGFDLHFLIRYGWSSDTDARTLNVGIGYDFNVPMLRESTDPDF